MTEKKKYNYSKCGKCGADKKPNAAGWCNKCHNQMRNKKTRPKYIYTKCFKCKQEKKPNGCGWCSKCNSEYRRNKPKEIPVRTLLKQLQEQVSELRELSTQLQKEIALLKPVPVIEPVTIIEPVVITEPAPVPIKIIKATIFNDFEHPRLTMIIKRMKHLHTTRNLKPDKLINLIEPIVKRNHYASWEELIMVMEYHDTLLNYEVSNNIYKKYLDLCLLYKSINK